jgi:hypothetical protein
LYRTSAELLKKEKYFFESSVGEYSNLNDVDKNKLLVERVESIVSAETSKYFTSAIQNKPKKIPNMLTTRDTDTEIVQMPF